MNNKYRSYSMDVKKIGYRIIYGILGTETTIVALKFHMLYKSGASIPFVAGEIIAPWWLLIEGTMIGFAPVITKMFIRALKNEEICDDSNLVNLINRINKKKGDNK
jgi:hypothetical protein